MKKNETNKKKVSITIFKILVGVSGLTARTIFSIPRVRISIGVPITGCSFFLASASKLNTSKIFSKLKLRYTELKEWMKMNTVTQGEFLKNSTIEKKKMDKKRNTKRFTITILIKKILKGTEKSHHERLGDVSGKAGISCKQILKPKSF